MQGYVLLTHEAARCQTSYGRAVMLLYFDKGEISILNQKRDKSDWKAG